MTMIHRYSRAWWLAGVLPLVTGCGSSGSAYQADPAQAQNTLRTVLDTWKTGEKPGSLENHAPPIRVKDLDWEGGFTLIDYKSDAEGRQVGYDMNYPVVLELKDPKGATVKKKAVYTVTTHPEILVMRQEG
jgi:hypothetical protein